MLSNCLPSSFPRAWSNSSWKIESKSCISISESFCVLNSFVTVLRFSVIPSKRLTNVRKFSTSFWRKRFPREYRMRRFPRKTFARCRTQKKISRAIFPPRGAPSECTALISGNRFSSFPKKGTRSRFSHMSRKATQSRRSFS